MVLLRALELQRSAPLMLTDEGLEERWQHHGSKGTSSRQHERQVAASSPASGPGLLVETTWQRKGGKNRRKKVDTRKLNEGSIEMGNIHVWVTYCSHRSE